MKKEKAKVNAFENNPLFREVLAEGLAIQDRFSAEPIYARTGKGYLKSLGVAELAEIKKMGKRLQLDPEMDYKARSLAGHIVAGVAGAEETEAFRLQCVRLGV